MKPTQKDLIEFAKQAKLGTALSHGGGELRIFIEGADWHEELLRFAELLLERFGAGDGEPVAFIHWPLSGAPRLVWYGYKALNAAILKAYEGHQPDMLLYTHPAPIDLRAEYLRGLDDAAKVCEYVATLYSEAARKHAEDSESRSRTFARSRAASQCVEEIRALKGKQ